MPLTSVAGTLRLLVNRVREFDGVGDCQPLAWDGYPPDAGWQDTMDDLELGDYECAPVPDLPTAGRGLWLLEWPWKEVPTPDDDEFMTAEYSAGAWRRPSVADLIELGALPGEG